MVMDFSRFEFPVLLRGDAVTAYRDPAVWYEDGVFHLYFTLVETLADGWPYLQLGEVTSRDLRSFSPVRRLTVRDRSLNYSSPGCVLRVGDERVLCFQSYCREHGEKYGNERSRLYVMRSCDLVAWGEPELLRVKGDGVAESAMGRMIDPYLLSAGGRHYCFFKQNGVSCSVSDDLRHWEYLGHVEGGENVCIVRDGDGWLMVHSPANGIGFKRSADLVTWEDEGRTMLGASDWPWAQGRLTAGFVLDLRGCPEVGKALLFFHGTGPEDERVVFDTQACIGLAWSDDLREWSWAGKEARR